MEWKTKITKLLGCKYPILEGAYGGFGNWKFAAAIAKTGAFGLITAGASRTPERLREDIKRCRDATDQPFGVNLSFGICPQIEKMLEVCIEEKVPVETAAYKPDSPAPRIKEGGVKWIHKSARVKDALHAEKLGADAIIVVGLEGAGFKSPEQLPTLITTVWATRQLKIPFIAAGGIGDARGFLGALGMGAEGIMMATAFMATKECPISDTVKEAMVRASPDDPQLCHRVLAPGDPQDYPEILKLRDQLPVEKWLPMLERARTKGLTPTLASELRTVSLAVAVIDGIPTVKELIDGIIREAEEIVANWQFLKTR